MKQNMLNEEMITNKLAQKHFLESWKDIELVNPLKVDLKDTKKNNIKILDYKYKIGKKICWIQYKKYKNNWNTIKKCVMQKSFSQFNSVLAAVLDISLMSFYWEISWM